MGVVRAIKEFFKGRQKALQEVMVSSPLLGGSGRIQK
jgi:hypothetical protein